MRNIFLKSSLALAFIGLLTNCSYEDKTIDKVLDGTTSGIVLKNLNIVSSEFNADNLATAKFEVNVQVRDYQGNNYIDKINVYGTYKDNNGVAANNRTERLIKTISKGSLTSGTDGFLNANVKVTLAEFNTAMTLTNAQILPCNSSVIRLEAVGTDGRKFSSTNASGTVTGGTFFNSPFQYAVNVVGGVLPDSLAGTHTYTSTNMFIPGTPSCGGTATGTVTWGATATPGLYTTTDMSFGLFSSTCWSDSPAVSGSSRVKWFCSGITSQGADQYGSNWTITIKSVVGNTMKLDFISNYSTGEGGTVTIVRQGGANWPAILQTN